MSDTVRFSSWVGGLVPALITLTSTDRFPVITDAPDTRAITRDNLAQGIFSTALTTDGDILTRSGGTAGRITRSSLADDPAFTNKYATQISELDDVDVTGFGDDSGLIYNSLSSKWESRSDVLVPVGTILETLRETAPNGYELMQGQTLVDAQTLLPKLWNALPSIFKSGSNIILPDMRGRVTVGAGTGSGLSSRVLGASGGVETHTLTTSELPTHGHTIDHGHTASQASHSHTVNAHGHTIDHGHTASQASHDHTVNSHFHTINHGHTASQASHSHTINNHTHSGTTASANRNHEHNFNHDHTASSATAGAHVHSGRVNFLDIPSQFATQRFLATSTGSVTATSGIQSAGGHNHTITVNTFSGNTSGQTQTHEHTYTTGNPSNRGTNSQTPVITVNAHSGNSGPTSPATNSQTPVITVNAHSGNSGNTSPATNSQTPVITVNAHSGNSGSTGNGLAHNIMQPFIVVNRMIRVK